MRACEKGHRKQWYWHPDGYCMKCVHAAKCERPKLRLVRGGTCPEGLCARCWENGEEVRTTSECGELCEAHVRSRADFKLGR